jgi:plasmid maintenance system antidote protein VapI
MDMEDSPDLGCAQSPSPRDGLRIEKAFGPDMDHLLPMQLAYDLAKTRGARNGASP